MVWFPEWIQSLLLNRPVFKSYRNQQNFCFLNLRRRVRQLSHVRLKGRMRVRNSVCFESYRGNLSSNGEKNTQIQITSGRLQLSTAGIEPASSEVTSGCHNHFATPSLFVLYNYSDQESDK